MSHWYSGSSFGVNSYALKTIISHILQKQDLDTGFTGDSQCRSGPVVGSTVSTHTRSKPSHIPPKQDLDTGFTGFWLRVCKTKTSKLAMGHALFVHENNA